MNLDRSIITAGGIHAAAIGPQLAQIVLGVSCLIFAVVLTAAIPGVRRAP